MNLKVQAMLVMLVTVVLAVIPPTIACGYCQPPKGGRGGGRQPPKGMPGRGGHKPPAPKPYPPKGKPPRVPRPRWGGKPPLVKPPPSRGYPPYTPRICPPPSNYCPKDALKIGTCVDLLGGLVNIGIGDPIVNECCPVFQRVLDLEAALCMCTTIRAKLLNIKIYFPLALELLVSCGKKPPSGFTCPLKT